MASKNPQDKPKRSDFLVIQIESERYLCPMADVVAVQQRLSDIHHYPGTKSWLRGCYRLSSGLVPLIDVKALIIDQLLELNIESCAISIQHETYGEIAILLSGVGSFIDVSDIEATEGDPTEYLLAQAIVLFGSVDGVVYPILDFYSNTFSELDQVGLV